MSTITTVPDLVVSLKEVAYTYVTAHHVHSLPNSRYAVPALLSATLDVHRGDRVILLGANGCGKSTLLGVVAGKHKPCGGNASVLGKDAFNETMLNYHVGFIGQIWPTGTNWTLTVRQTVEMEQNVDWARFDSLCEILAVGPAWRVDQCSSGMKRRIQILLGLLFPKEVICLDEFTTDLDVVERSKVLTFLKEQSIKQKMTLLYATHIFDFLEGFPTHIAHMEAGRVLSVTPIVDVKEALGPLSYRMIGAYRNPPREAATPFLQAAVTTTGSPAIVTKDLVFSVGRSNQGKFSNAKLIFEGLSFSVPKGSRCLLVGTNGAGKTTLLRLLAGKHFLKEGQLTVAGSDAFHCTTLNQTVGYSGDWWYSSEWDLTVMEMMAGDKVDEARLARVAKVLDVDVNWRLNRVSNGQRKRIQLLLNMHQLREVLLLDEVTADLDTVQRQEFLKFLYDESIAEGCTILYATHIFDGLDGWPTHIVVVDSLTHQLHSVLDCSAGEGPLLQRVAGVLFGLKEGEWAKEGIPASPYYTPPVAPQAPR